MMKHKVIPEYMFDKTVLVRFLDHPAYKLAKYHSLSLEGFSCICSYDMSIGDIFRIEINLKMISGGTVDDIHPNVARAELIASDEKNGDKFLRFSFIEFENDCYDRFVRAVDYLEKQENLIFVPDDSYQTLDIRKGQTIQEIMDSIILKIRNGELPLPVLPKIVQDVENVIADIHASGDDLATVIEKDAVISVKLISTANSPFYRGRSHIVTVREAISRLGFGETRNLVLTITNKSMYRSKNKMIQDLLEKLWIHSLACAYSSKEIASAAGISQIDSVFTLGLIHRIGQVLLLRILSQSDMNDLHLSKQEIIHITDLYNPEISCEILQHWNFPDSAIHIIRTFMIPDPENSENSVVYVIHAADLLARSMGYGIQDESIDISDITLPEYASLDLKSLKKIGVKLKAIMSDSSSVL